MSFLGGGTDFQQPEGRVIDGGEVLLIFCIMELEEEVEENNLLRSGLLTKIQDLEKYVGFWRPDEGEVPKEVIQIQSTQHHHLLCGDVS